MERTDLLELMATLLVSDTVTKAQMSMSSSSSHETPRWRGSHERTRLWNQGFRASFWHFIPAPNAPARTRARGPAAVGRSAAAANSC